MWELHLGIIGRPDLCVRPARSSLRSSLGAVRTVLSTASIDELTRSRTNAVRRATAVSPAAPFRERLFALRPFALVPLDQDPKVPEELFPHDRILKCRKLLWKVFLRYSTLAYRPAKKPDVHRDLVNGRSL